MARIKHFKYFKTCPEIIKLAVIYISEGEGK